MIIFNAMRPSGTRKELEAKDGAAVSLPFQASTYGVSGLLGAHIGIHIAFHNMRSET
jgi:hypothetical protein